MILHIPFYNVWLSFFCAFLMFTSVHIVPSFLHMIVSVCNFFPLQWWYASSWILDTKSGHGCLLGTGSLGVSYELELVKLQTLSCVCAILQDAGLFSCFYPYM
ncbi:hypothetical protein NE237_029571 [Protea cynaroides]|uniref:Uncharacterized protein n=1 Tax=Protea cynaroides TaxID=273540 RepID=A0A9Q0GSF8_9MAGN|nr:hypothetical protein NE237_029571 [Protea cynaroides]